MEWDMARLPFYLPLYVRIVICERYDYRVEIGARNGWERRGVNVNGQLHVS